MLSAKRARPNFKCVLLNTTTLVITYVRIENTQKDNTIGFWEKTFFGLQKSRSVNAVSSEAEQKFSDQIERENIYYLQVLFCTAMLFGFLKIHTTWFFMIAVCLHFVPSRASYFLVYIFIFKGGGVRNLKDLHSKFLPRPPRFFKTRFQMQILLCDTPLSIW